MPALGKTMLKQNVGSDFIRTVKALAPAYQDSTGKNQASA
jgi:hypothetical protein